MILDVRCGVGKWRRQTSRQRIEERGTDRIRIGLGQVDGRSPVDRRAQHARRRVASGPNEAGDDTVCMQQRVDVKATV